MPRQRQIQVLPLPGQGGGAFIQPYDVPIVANYNPTTLDQCDALGQTWVNTVNGSAWIATQFAANSTTWTSVSNGAGTFSSVTINGAGPGALVVTSLGTGVLFSNAGTINSQNLNNGQLMIGNSSGVPVAATLTAGPGISISNGPGTITISETGSGVTWSAETTSFSATAGNGYVITAGSGSVNATLPTNNALGDTVEVIYPSATASDVLELSSGSGANLRFPGNATAFTHLTWPACNLSGAANPSVVVVCTTASATVPVWTVTEVTGSPTGS